MRSRIDDPQRLERFINSFSSYHSDSKALVLRLVAQLGNVAQVATLTGISERTIYAWMEEWNKKKRMD